MLICPMCGEPLDAESDEQMLYACSCGQLGCIDCVDPMTSTCVDCEAEDEAYENGTDVEDDY
jgi:hypothetical protein